MALLFAEGFDLVDSNTDLLSAAGMGPGYFTITSFSSSGGRYGGGAPTITGNTSSYAGFPFVAARGDTVYFGFSIYPQGAYPANAAFMLFLSQQAATLLKLYLSVGGSITAEGQDGTIFSPSGDVQGLTPYAWHWVEIAITFGTTSSNGSFEIRIDGVTYLTGATMDTDAGSTHFPAEVAFNGMDQGLVLDDMMIWSSSGAAPNTWLGGARIVTLRPTADGAVVNWTANTGADYAAVDDANGSSDGDTTYIASSTSTQRSRFTMDNLPNAGDTIQGVQVRLRAKKTNQTERAVQGYIRSSTTETDTSSIYLPDDYIIHRGSFIAVDPNGGGAWTKSAIDAMEVGVEHV